MRHHNVESSQIKSVHYDEDNEILEVEFRSNNRRYRYADVPPGKVDALLAADSIGRYFEAHIKHQHAVVKLR